MSRRAKVYEGAEVTVTFDASRCIHHAHCVRRLPQVFNTAARPWVQPDNAPADEVLRIVRGCPTGALQAVHRDGTSADAPTADAPVTIRITRDGPLFVQGAARVVDGDDTPLGDDIRQALCRCGLSQRKPYCDNSHRAAGWTASPKPAP